MKKRVCLIVFVSMILIAGISIVLMAGDDNQEMPAEGEAKKPQAAESTGETSVATEDESSTAAPIKPGKSDKKQPEKEMSKETKPEEEKKSTEDAPESKPQSVQPEQQEKTEPTQSSAEVPKQEEPKPEESKPEETEPEEPKPQEQTVTEVPYNPASVCSQAIAKCQAGGMITTTDNLTNLLAEGKITQEEYDSYYPYDGLGYYSVFVETDLNQASTTSGTRLGSEDEIAEYIAEMMLLETEPVFYIEYAGVYNLNGTDFYEFRCYR